MQVRRCPKCSGMLYIDANNDESCRNCGWSGPTRAPRPGEARGKGFHRDTLAQKGLDAMLLRDDAWPSADTCPDCLTVLCYCSDYLRAYRESPAP